MAAIHGYHIHSMNLLLRDYQRGGQEVRVPASDSGLQPPFVFLNSVAEAPPLREAFLCGLKVAVANGHRLPEDGFLYGPDALAAWFEALAGYDAYGAEDRGLLFLVNWWSLMHLADARQAAADFLAENASLVTGEAAEPLRRATGLYREEAAAVKAFADEHAAFIPWWGGVSGVGDWDRETRQRQADLLRRVRALELQALDALGETLAQVAG